MRYAAALALLLTSSAWPADKVDLVRGRVETKGDVWVGQRVTVVIELLSPTFFASAPAFDLPQVPGLVILPPEGRPVVGSEQVRDDTYSVQRHELAVYAERPGTIRLPPIRVRFATAGVGGKLPVPHQGQTREMTFTAKLPPGAEGLSTVITTHELTVKESWKPDPGKASVGDAFTRSVTIRAKDVPGMVLPPMRWDAPEGLAVYPATPAVSDAADRGEVTGRRVESVTYVCERAGTFTVPALSLTWWDLGEKKLKRVRLPARTFEVAPVVLLPENESEHVASERGRSHSWRFVAVGLAVGCLALLWFARARLEEWWQRCRLAFVTSERAAFARFRKACRSGDPRAIYRTLISWLGHLSSGTATAPMDWLMSRFGDAALTNQLVGLEGELFGQLSAARPAAWSPSELYHEVSRARQTLRKHPIRHRSAGLPPLNPA